MNMLGCNHTMYSTVHVDTFRLFFTTMSISLNAVHRHLDLLLIC